jgi:hypothetical protein
MINARPHKGTAANATLRFSRTLQIGRRMAGYSGTPLAKKLGIKAGSRLRFVRPPETFLADLGTLPEGAVLLEGKEGAIDVLVLFVGDLASLRKDFAKMAARITPNGMLWVAWPKKSSGVVTDINENLVREHGLAEGLVDVKVCAIDETWSGLKFVIRLKDRPGRS